MDNHKTLLSRTQLVNRRKFDPANESHRNSLQKFLTTGNWGEIQFCAELPYIDVPSTVLTKYAIWSLEKEMHV